MKIFSKILGDAIEYKSLEVLISIENKSLRALRSVTSCKEINVNVGKYVSKLTRNVVIRNFVVVERRGEFLESVT